MNETEILTLAVVYNLGVFVLTYCLLAGRTSARELWDAEMNEHGGEEKLLPYIVILVLLWPLFPVFKWIVDQKK